MYPKLLIDLACIRENAKTVIALCESHHIGVTAVTKVFRGDPVIAQVYIDAGASRLGDSRVDNLKRMHALQAEKWLIRPPMLSEIPELVRWGDASLNSEITVIRRINEECRKQGKMHKILLMTDLGDLREGYVSEDELLSAAREVESLDYVELLGIGTNLTCFSFILPDTEKMQLLGHRRKLIEQGIGRPLCIVSGGNSATIALMLNGGIPPEVNNLRLGESLLFGKERAGYTYLPNTRNTSFTLQCEIIEKKAKPSIPWGTVGVDSYGRKPTFQDRGDHRVKVICALGKQDFDLETTTVKNPGILMLGASSDHLMLDVTESVHPYKIGDVVDLQLGYFSTMRAFTSEYVEKTYLN